MRYVTKVINERWRAYYEQQKKTGWKPTKEDDRLPKIDENELFTEMEKVWHFDEKGITFIHNWDSILNGDLTVPYEKLAPYLDPTFSFLLKKPS